jgi:Fe-S cluster biogenesis protein NfuA
LEHSPIVETNVDLSNETSVGEVTIAPTVAGKVVVKYDGVCRSDPGNYFEISVSTQENIADYWSQLYPVSEDVDQNSFSRTRVFEVEPGSHTFYAVSLITGTNTGSIYGSLTVEFFPENEYIVKHTNDLYELNTIADYVTEVESLNITAPEAGQVIVQFDGSCIVSPGDRPE